MSDETNVRIRDRGSLVPKLMWVKDLAPESSFGTTDEKMDELLKDSDSTQKKFVKVRHGRRLFCYLVPVQLVAELFPLDDSKAYARFDHEGNPQPTA
ncbi:hypothetical protein [Streptomyces europaeiscabiei]|uniref:hypothetical protein n=1 Tax=Streptomyces europaeiscabiei TaxID=146819 RepID=UPI002E16DB19